MAGVLVKIQDAVFQRRVAALQQGLTDASKLMKIWGEIAKTSIAENFEAGGRPQHWQPLAASTIQARIGGRKQLRKLSAKNQRRGRNPFAITFLRPLWNTGTLKQITVRPEQARVVIGSSPAARDYAAIHQFGGQAGRGKKVTIPARPYILLQAEDEAEMAREARRYLQRLVL